ncbi:glycosyltransferase [Microbacterium hominis]|uniref:Glycosyltransferase n=1 Tax=Microbacterium hominis TaxID=162426 RepID=A0A7D4PWB7_9MICO|nr:glycosyltransferase [Microbacterium hominis]QKJ20354.1 glycosyltransferase [Microbacterium hominis]
MTRRAGTLVPFPAWEGNPYLGMLSLAAEAAGWSIAGHKGIPGLASELPRLRPGDAVHVHWTSPITAGAHSEADAHERRIEFRDLLMQFRSRGVTILWTVHNEVAHDARYPEADRAVANDLAAIADVIIQLHDHTEEFVRHSFALPAAKIFTLPHSSYLGIYEDGRDARAARASLGVSPGTPTVGFVGQLRPYKGVDALFRAADLAAADVPDLTLLVAGKLAPRDAVDFMAEVPKRARLILHPSFVEPSDLWKWFRASDVIALPYRKVLNSGSVPLAATFDRACVVPDDTALAREYRDETWVRAYSTARNPDRALADLLVELVSTVSPESNDANAFARRHAPYEMSRAYLELLERAVSAQVALG